MKGYTQEKTILHPGNKVSVLAFRMKKRSCKLKC